MIRKARISDVKAIHGLLSEFGEEGILLPRPLSDLYDHLRDYTVFEAEGEGVVGTVALHIVWEDLAEVRSLAVKKGWQGKGVGSRLVEHALSEAALLGIYRIFTLTYKPEFFERLGFRPIDKKALPHKVWADCVRCPKFPDCDETALLLEL